MILLADRVNNQKEGGQPLLGGLDVTINRNFFGSQVKSFETNLNIPQLGDEKPFPAVFIRAPVITEAGPSVEQVLAKLSETQIVAVKQKNLLGTAFHPELTADTRFHRYFAQIVRQYKEQLSSGIGCAGTEKQS